MIGKGSSGTVGVVTVEATLCAVIRNDRILLQRKAAGRWKFTTKDPGRPDTPARVGVRLHDQRASEERPASRGQEAETRDKLSTELIPLSKEDVEADGPPEELRFKPKPNTLGPALVDDVKGSTPE